MFRFALSCLKHTIRTLLRRRSLALQKSDSPVSNPFLRRTPPCRTTWPGGSMTQVYPRLDTAGGRDIHQEQHITRLRQDQTLVRPGLMGRMRSGEKEPTTPGCTHQVGSGQAHSSKRRHVQIRSLHGVKLQLAHTSTLSQAEKPGHAAGEESGRGRVRPSAVAHRHLARKRRKNRDSSTIRRPKGLVK